MQDFDYAIDEADVQVPCGLTFAGMTPRGCFAGGSALSGPAADIGRQAGRLKSLLTADHLGKGTAVAWLSLQPGDGDISAAMPVALGAGVLVQRFIKFVSHAFRLDDAAFEAFRGRLLAGAHVGLEVRARMAADW